jgi:hypothetical protein
MAADMTVVGVQPDTGAQVAGAWAEVPFGSGADGPNQAR